MAVLLMRGVWGRIEPFGLEKGETGRVQSYELEFGRLVWREIWAYVGLCSGKSSPSDGCNLRAPLLLCAMSCTRTHAMDLPRAGSCTERVFSSPTLSPPLGYRECPANKAKK